jgi:hypothetical protein
MFNSNYNYGIAKVHLMNAPLLGCQPQEKKPEVGWWETNVTNIPPDGTIIGARDGQSYQIDYCRSSTKGCMEDR